MDCIILFCLLILTGTWVVGGADIEGATKSALPVAFIPKDADNIVFDMAYSGAIAAHGELSNSGELEQLAAPVAATSGIYQIDVVQRITEVGGYGAILLSNNADNDIAPSTIKANNSGIKVVTWDSFIPSGVLGGESLFVAQVNFYDTGKVLADMALDILGPEGGQYAILSASRKAPNQNAWITSMDTVMAENPAKYGALEKVEVAYGDDDKEVSYAEAKRLTETYPDLKLIVSPTTVGILATSKAMTDLGKCDSVKVTGLGLPAEMLDYTLSGCAPLFSLWDFVDLGYLAYYAGYRLTSGELEVKEGQTFEAGRLGTFTVERDPTREDAYRVVMGDFKIYNKNNVENAAYYEAVQGDGGQDTMEDRYLEKYAKKALAIIPKVTGMISFLALTYIVWHVLSDRKRRRETANRVLVGIGISGMLASFFGFFLSTWPVPSDTWLVWGNVGNQGTCTMQGFFFQAGISATPLYAGALTTVYLLRVVLRVKKDRLVQVELFMHGFVNLIAWGTAIAGLPLKLYNSADRIGFMCWIAEYPPYCSLRDKCERGRNAYMYRWAFLYAWVFVVVGYMIVCMIVIYKKVLAAEKASDRWRSAAGQTVIRSQSTKVAKQGLLYVVAFIVPWLFGITLSVLKEQNYGDIEVNQPVALEVANAIIWPLGGLLNFLVYMRPGDKSSDNLVTVAQSTQNRREDRKSLVQSAALQFRSFVRSSVLSSIFRSKRWSKSGEATPSNASGILGSADRSLDSIPEYSSASLQKEGEDEEKTEE